MKINRTIDISKIKLLVLDVDGTLTDGKLYIGNTGELFKVFDIKDGSGIHDILPQIGIKPVIITARKSDIVKHRCEELNIDLYFMGIRDKAEKLKALCGEFGFSLNENGVYSEVAYVGDDIIDIPIMKLAGLKGCPKNASKPVIDIADWVSDYNGGQGAVREIIDCLYR